MSDTIEELEDLVAEQEPEPKPDNSALLLSKIAYNVGITVIDAGTGYLVGALTFWYYGVIWFLAGAVVFFMHQKNYFTPGTNEKQQRGSRNGLIVSVASMVIMALAAGGLYVFSVISQWVEVGLIVVSISLFSWHLYSLAMFVFEDDGFKIENTVARSFATANKKVRIAKASGTVVSAYRKAADERNRQYSKHGRANVDAAIGKMENRQPQPRQMPQGTPTMPVMASDGGKLPALREKAAGNPTKEPGR